MGIDSKAAYRYYQQSDLESWRLTGCRRSDKVKRPTVYLQYILRRVEYYKYKKGHSRFSLLYKVLHRVELYRLNKLKIWMGVTVYPSVFGPGLHISHYGDVVIHHKAKIGSNCRISGGVTVGQSRGKVPKIGDNVFLGAGSKVIGGVIVGDNVTVGANAVVTKDVESNTIVAGVPAKVIKTGVKNQVRQGADIAKKKPLSITRFDKVMMFFGLDRDLRDRALRDSND